MLRSNETVEKMDKISGASKKKKSRSDLSEQTQLLGLMLSLGFTVTMCIVAGVLGGIWLDRQQWLPDKIGALIGAVLGLLIAFFWSWMRISRHLAAYPPPERRKPALFENHEKK